MTKYTIITTVKGDFMEENVSEVVIKVLLGREVT